MRILQVHCQYRSGTSGEDSALEQEARLLVERGHTVMQYMVSNQDLEGSSVLRRIATALRAVWNPSASSMIHPAVDASGPDLIHVYNTFAMLSPTVYRAAAAFGVPVVSSLQNYRPTCATSLLLRDGAPCQECVGKVPWAALRHGCRYGNSRAAGAVIALTQAVHFTAGTYTRKISAHVVMTEWQKQVMVKAGLPAGRIYVKPNFTYAAPVIEGTPAMRKQQILFAGQLGSAKGVDLLLDAWGRIPHHGYRLVFAGADTVGEGMPQRISQYAGAEWIGHLPREQLMREIAASRWLVLPSRWYEGLPMVLVEAKSAATPAIGPSHGSFVDVIRPGIDGLRFAPGDVRSLAATLRQALETAPAVWQSLSEAARADHRERYSPEANYEVLMRIYERVLGRTAAHAAKVALPETEFQFARAGE